MNRLTLAVAIPTFGREEILCRTIQEIFKQSILPDEFVIIDQSEHHLPETVKFLEESARSGRLRWIKHYPPSTSGAKNRAVVETTSEIIVFLDDDVTTHTDFLSEHLKNYTDPQIDAVAGQVRTKDHWDLTDRMPEGIDLTDPEDVIFRMLMTYNQRVFAPKIWGANFSLRRRTIINLRGFNEYVPTLGEDLDLIFRLCQQRSITVFDPRAWVFHHDPGYGGGNILAPIPWRQKLQRSVGHFYVGFRYMTPGKKVWHIYNNFRGTVWRKGNLLKMRNLAEALAIFAIALPLGYNLSKKGEILSPFLGNYNPGICRRKGEK